MNVDQKLLVFTFLLLFINFKLLGKEIRYGKFSKEEISITECSFEKEAPAIILSKTCDIVLNYSVIQYFNHVRIKILNEEGLKWANVVIPYYRKDDLENVTGVRGQTVNFGVDGKEETTDLEGKSVFTVDVDEWTGETRFSMPNVKVGSIIEYKYTTNSHFYSYLDTWYFQDEIPTLYNSLKVNMPESFRYDLVMFGDRLEAKYPEPKNEWILTDLPSIKEESHVNNYHDFVEQIRFQLVGYFTRNESSLGREPVFKTVKTNWEDLASEYLGKIDFLGRKGFAQKQLEGILNGSENNWEKIEKIYDFVRINIKWDGNYRLYPEKFPPKIVEEKVASNSEINLLLVLLLREAGIPCNPALGRTNKRGLIQKEYPLMSQFNQVFACVELYSKEFFLNAISPYRPYQILAEEDLNYFAFVLDKAKPHWAQIKANSKTNRNVIVSYDYSNLKTPILKLQLQETGYFAVNSRKVINEEKVETWIGNLFSFDSDDLKMDSVHVENQADVNLPLVTKFEFIPQNDQLESNPILYFTPFTERERKNPFLAEERQYRIDFNYPSTKMYLVKIKIPKGYHFESYPKSKRLMLPGESGVFTLQSQVEGNELTLRTSFSIKIPSFDKMYYPNLREFYSQMTTLLNSQVVVKRDEIFSKK